MLFLLIQKVPGLYKFTFKLIPLNDLYPKNSIRTVNRSGLNYALDISDYQEWLIYFNANADNSKVVLDYIGDASFILDIGANVGQTSLWIAQHLNENKKNYKIFAFEPHPTTYSKMLNNLGLNPGFKITPVNIGLGSKSSELELVEDCETNSGGFRIGKITDSKKGIIIPIQTVDSFVVENQLSKIDFIKIDVEGFEYHVLLGAINTLTKWKPTLFIEFCPENLRKQQTEPEEILGFLTDLGYEIKDVNSNAKQTDLYTFEGMTDLVCAQRY